MNRKFLSAGGMAIAVVILIALNMTTNAALRGKQIDLTEDKLYTLSEGTKRVLEKIEEPVTMRLYFSEKLAQRVSVLAPFKAYHQRVDELLQQYVAHSGGQITLTRLDPEPFSEIEDQAAAAGLEGVPLPGSSDSFYFGLAATGSTDAEQVIPFFQPEKETTLEYDLTKLVHSLAKPDKLVVGVLSSLPIEGEAPNPFMQQRQAPQPWFVMDQLRQLYETRTVPPNAKEIPAEVKVLMIVHPKNLGPATLYAIDQFVLRGGKVLCFVDPYCEADQPIADPSNPLSQMTASRASDLKPLFDQWGVQLVEGKLAADRDSAMHLPWTNQRGKQDEVEVVYFLNLDKDHFNQEEVLTNELKLVRVGMAGILQKKEGATTEFAPLMHTSKNSMQINVSDVQFRQDPSKLLADFFASDTEQVLAARITGTVKSAFPDGKPKAPEGEADDLEEPPSETADAPHLAESTEPIHVIVVADADMLDDRFWVRVQDLGGMRLGMPTADNGNFVSNTLDYMQGSTDMISLRSRRGMARPFERVDEMRKDAEQRYRAEEQRLLSELEKAEQRINELQAKKQGQSTMFLSPEQEAEIDRWVAEKVETRKKLRQVRHDLNGQIEALGSRIKFANIFAIPLLVAAIGVGAFAARRNRKSSK